MGIYHIRVVPVPGPMIWTQPVLIFTEPGQNVSNVAPRIVYIVPIPPQVAMFRQN